MTTNTHHAGAGIPSRTSSRGNPFPRVLTPLLLVLSAMPRIGPASPSTQPADTLPGTIPLTMKTDFAADMVAGIGHFLDRELTASIQHRAALWHPDFSSTEDYIRSIAPNRAHLARIIGAVDERSDAGEMAEVVSTVRVPALVAETDSYTAHAVRWPVLPGVDGEGLLLQPKTRALIQVVALPDADQTPEMLVGLAPGLSPEWQFARRLAENGCRVLVPVLIDRSCEWSGNPRLTMTNQPHREWIYRMSFEVGRHIIGYEVQRIRAGAGCLLGVPNPGPTEPLTPLTQGLMGYGEGGLLAFYAGALDPQITSTVVSGYFRSRQGVWQEPVYRNVWGLLAEFGDAEIASLIAPRTLIIEAGRGPQVAGPPKRDKHGEAAPGTLVSPPLDCVKGEFDRARPPFEKLNVPDHLALIEAGNQGPGTDATLAAFLKSLGSREPLKPPGPTPKDLRGNYDPKPRLHRQFDQLVEYTQKFLRESQYRRREFWAKTDSVWDRHPAGPNDRLEAGPTPDQWATSCEPYREYFYSQVIGKLDPPSLPANPRSRKFMDEPKFTGYEVMLDVYPDVFAYGVLLLPNDLKPGERRPVVVCQHGLEGTPDPAVNPKTKGLYNSFGAKLADQGFVVFAPQNPYIGGDRFRILQRKANPLGKSLFSFITRQHERILEWLADQPFVDGKRIGFYGISYGGKTAMRVPALLPQYALSICSADFNEWEYKAAGSDYPFGFMCVNEYEVYEFDMANRFGHAEMAGLIAPRPFMVERGHADPVAPDEWVGYEYAKVRRLYDQLGIGDMTAIEFFNGGHEIHAVGTFEFLHKHLKY